MPALSSQVQNPTSVGGKTLLSFATRNSQEMRSMAQVPANLPSPCPLGINFPNPFDPQRHTSQENSKTNA